MSRLKAIKLRFFLSFFGFARSAPLTKTTFVLTLKYYQIAIASFIGYAFGMNTTVVGGSAARYRILFTRHFSSQFCSLDIFLCDNILVGISYCGIVFLFAQSTAHSKSASFTIFLRPSSGNYLFYHHPYLHKSDFLYKETIKNKRMGI